MAYMRRGALVERFTVTASSGGTLTLVNNSTTFQVITGFTSHVVVLPDATTCDGGSTGKGGQKFYVINNSTGRVEIRDNGGARILFLPSKSEVMLILTDDTNPQGTWSYNVPTIVDQPLRASAGEPADSKIYFKANTVTDFDGTELVTPPIKGLIPLVPPSSHDLQTGATDGATFTGAALPTTGIGEFRRIGYSLLPTGVIQVLYTPPAATEGALADAGTVFAKGALPICWVDVEAYAANSFKTIDSSSNVIENFAGGESRIHKFGSGGGGGSGTGDANSFLEDLKAFLRCSSYEWVTPNIFSINEQNLVDITNTTAVYDGANSWYAMGPSDFVLSTNLFGAQFLASSKDCAEVDLQVSYDPTGTDPAPVLHVSRDNGVNFVTAAANRVGESNKWLGNVQFPNESTLTELSENPLTDDDTNLTLNATTGTAFAQPFTVTSKSSVRKLSFKIDKLGAPVGNLFVKIVRDDSGEPSSDTNDILYAGSPLSMGVLATGIHELESLNTVLTQGDYWIVFETDALYKTNTFGSNALRIRADGSAPAVPVASAFETGWTPLSSAISYLIEGIEFGLIIRIESGASDVYLLGFGAFYAKNQAGDPVYSTPKVHRIGFPGDDDQYEFSLPFIPDPDLLRVYDIRTGQVYTYPAFDISNNVITFVAGTFLVPGETILLLFTQDGGSYDNADRNRALMAENGLGGQNGNDASSPGVGPKIRSPNGQLWQLQIQDNGAILTTPILG